ncbi:hypothetical protein CYMTET_46779, partial [Cymbomonas tetramitiformis]
MPNLSHAPFYIYVIPCASPSPLPYGCASVPSGHSYECPLERFCLGPLLAQVSEQASHYTQACGRGQRVTEGSVWPREAVTEGACEQGSVWPRQAWPRAACDRGQRVTEGRHVTGGVWPRQACDGGRHVAKGACDGGQHDGGQRVTKGGVAKGNGQDKRGRPQYCANVGIKINAKLGGVNSVISASAEMPFERHPNAALSWLAENFEREPFMFLGADVTHSVVKSENARSIAAVVGSMNASATLYSTRILVQPGGTNVEMIGALETATSELLDEFHHKNGQYPARLVMYRDGVAEGEFNEVILQELPQIQAACAGKPGAYGVPYNPLITIIIVQKRHHTRFFPDAQN